jgi:hypothetical protein
MIRGEELLKGIVSVIVLILLLLYVSTLMSNDNLIDSIIHNGSLGECVNVRGDGNYFAGKYTANCFDGRDEKSGPASLCQLEKYEANCEQFRETEINDKIVYFYQRKIGEAIVEKDFVVYQFDKNTGELLAKKVHWRDDLLEYLPKMMIAKEQAESKVEGEVQFSRIYIISPESDVFPIEPAPKNPCWVVRSVDESNLIVTIIDAVNGEVLGNGVPPPYTGFSFSGPQYFDPCGGVWYDWYKNAEFWFNEMGYSTESAYWPTEEKIKSHIQSNETAMFYEVAHSGGKSTQFKSGCLNGNEPEYTYAYEIEEWIANYTEMPFTFLASCFSMCNTSDGTLSHEFRKGSTEDTVTVGYCNMSDEKCDLCWTYSLQWQNTLFSYMNQSYTVKYAFDQANVDYPACACADCMRFVGDNNFKAVPKVKRVPTVHDVAIIGASSSKTMVGNGLALGLNVFAENQGDFTETFNVTIYANGITINMTQIILSTHSFTSLTFYWNTTDFTKGNYTISAYIVPVENEMDTADNSFKDGWVVVTIPGDVDGDFDVDIYDVVKLCAAYGYEMGDLEYEANCDIDGDGDIDIYDIVIMCNHYGEAYP